MLSQILVWARVKYSMGASQICPPEVGSSSSNAAGVTNATSSQAMLTRFSWPPEMLAAAWGDGEREGGRGVIGREKGRGEKETGRGKVIEGWEGGGG